MLGELFRSKKEKEGKEGARFQEKISELSETVTKLSKQQSEVEEKVSQLSEEISQIHQEVAEISKKIAIESSQDATGFRRRVLSIVKEEVEKRENRFIPIVKEMAIKEVKSIPESKELNFILAILKILPRKADRHSFWSLVNAIWLDFYLKKKVVSRSDCRDALSALIEFTDVLKIDFQNEHPHRNYIFNEKSKFYWKWAPLFYIPSQE